jgi:hypothetical protein
MRTKGYRSTFVSMLVIAGLVIPIGAAAAAPGDVVISEFMYHPESDVSPDEFLEIHNAGGTSVDISDWCFSGITFCFPPGANLPAGAFVVVAEDATAFQSAYGFAPDGIYTKSLSNGGETLELLDAGGAIIDEVTYDDAAPWPVTPDGLGPSLELIDPSLDNDDYLNWAASTAAAGHTAGESNSVAATGLGPRITDVVATPANPGAADDVVVTATITDVAGATLFYRVNFGSEQTVALAPTGGDGYAATIPDQSAGDLIRYRIEATNANTTNAFPRVDDTITYEGVFVVNGLTSNLPIFEWFIPDGDYDELVDNPTVDIDKKAVLVYDGTVYDNVQVNIRGKKSQTAPKVNWKFEMPQGHDFDMPGFLVEPVDEFAVQADWSDHAHGRTILGWDAYGLAGVANMEIFPVRVQRNGDFQGLYRYMGLFDGTWREREGYEDDQFFKASTGAFDDNRPLEDNRFEKKTPKDEDYTVLEDFLDGIALSGNAQRNYLLENADIPQMINYAAVTAILAHHDSSSKNFYFTQSPDTGRWSILPWDLDHSLGNPCCGVDSDFVTPAEPGDKTNDLMEAILDQPEWTDMYFRRLATLVDEILEPGRMESVYDTVVGPSEPEADLDFVTWPHQPWHNYDNQRSKLFDAIDDRRAAFTSDPRVPAPQGAAPNIVINEIQYDPAAGGDAEYLELYNPSSSQAIDLSDWSITDAVDLEIQPGTVILPESHMVFVADDPTFRTTYGDTIFVGDRFGGGLSSGETITLVRADGSTADQVTYGGAGWPTATGGPSLELINPLADNNDPANWGVSNQPLGTPGAQNDVGGGGPDGVAPTTAVSFPGSGATVNTSSVTLAGSASDNVDVDRVEVSLQNTATGQWLQPGGGFAATFATLEADLVDDQGSTTDWELPTTLADGPYTVTATAVDTSGNNDASPAVRSFTVDTAVADTIAPDGAIVFPSPGQTVTTNVVTITGTVSDNVDVGVVDVAIRNRDTKQWLQPDGSFANAWKRVPTTITADNGASVEWEFTTPALGSGRYRVILHTWDAAGNKEQPNERANFVVDAGGGGPDTVDPDGTISYPADNAVLTNGVVTLTGTATDNVDVQIVDIAIRNRDTGQWLQPNGTFASQWRRIPTVITVDNGTVVDWEFGTPDLANGRYRAMLYVFDAAGNKDETKAFARFTIE